MWRRIIPLVLGVGWLMLSILIMLDIAPALTMKVVSVLLCFIFAERGFEDMKREKGHEY